MNVAELKGLSDTALMGQVLGCLLADNSLIDNVDYPLSEDDFETDSFYKMSYAAIFNLWNQGAENIDAVAVDGYLSAFPEQYAVFTKATGLGILLSLSQAVKVENYPTYYRSLRKLGLLRYYEKEGFDTRCIYDPQKVTMHPEEKFAFDEMSLQEIVERVESKMVITPNMRYCTNTLSVGIQAGEGMLELLDSFEEEPDIGLPLNNEFFNSIVRGARLGKLYMRSAPSGYGKSRLAAGDACTMAVPYVWSNDENDYVYTGFSEPTLYITTEMPPDEIQTLFMSAVSKVNEASILNGTLTKEEKERVVKSIGYIEDSPLFIEHIPDFSITDITNIIKKYNRQYGVQYFIFDYIHSSLRLMSEINNRSGGGLKEYQMLLVFATELKAIAEKLNVFILTASQVNSETIASTHKDANLLQGSKALANKLDVGAITVEPSPSELKKLQPIRQKFIGMETPNMAYWIYKVRRGKYTRIIIWSKVDLGTMTEKPLFITDYDITHVINIDITKATAVKKLVQEYSVPITTADKKIDTSQEENETEDKKANEDIKEEIDVEENIKPDNKPSKFIF